MQGYTIEFARKVRAGDKSKRGVVLGAIALSKGIPVANIAEYVGVSRTAVYGWFLGKYDPSRANALRLEEYVVGYAEAN